MSEPKMKFQIEDTFAIAASRAIAMEVRGLLARYDARFAPEDEYALGNTIRGIIEQYDSGRVQQIEEYKKLAMDSIMLTPKSIYWHGLDPVISVNLKSLPWVDPATNKCRTCGFPHSLGTINDHAFYPEEPASK